MQNIATHQSKIYLSENLKTLMGGFSQDRLSKLEKKSGVSARTIANMVSQKTGNPTLANICAIADAYKISPSILLSKDLGKTETVGLCPESILAGSDSSATSPHESQVGRSQELTRIIARLSRLESAQLSPPALYSLIENALDLIQPIASGSDYAGLDDL